MRCRWNGEAEIGEFVKNKLDVRWRIPSSKSCGGYGGL